MVDRNSIDRRQFLQSGLLAATLVAAGRLPLLASETGTGSGIDTSGDEYAAKPIRSYLMGFSPPEKSLRARGQYTLNYNIVHWNGGTRATDRMSNSVVGSVAIKRRPENDQVIYEVTQKTQIGGVDNVIEAQIICNPDELSSLRKWNLRTYHTGPGGGIEPLSQIKESGGVGNGSIRVSREGYSCDYTAENPVVTRWTVLDYLIRKADPALSVAFDLLEDLSLFKPNQSLAYDGETHVTLKGGKTVTLQTYAQTGEGILPIHYLLDANGCPQLITSSILSWALSG